MIPKEKILEAMNNELDEAKLIVDTAIEKNDRQLLYKTYSFSKLLFKYLEEHLKTDEPLAKSVDKWLRKLAIFIQDNARVNNDKHKEE